MKTRVVAGVLWFLCGWYAGAAVAWALAFSPTLAPILGVAAAVLFAGDPLGVIWGKRAEPARVTPLDLETLPEDLAQAA